MQGYKFSPPYGSSKCSIRKHRSVEDSMPGVTGSVLKMVFIVVYTPMDRFRSHERLRILDYLCSHKEKEIGWGEYIASCTIS
jgi:hypothetical protein